MEELRCFRLIAEKQKHTADSITNFLKFSIGQKQNLHLHNLDFFSLLIEPTMHDASDMLQNTVFEELWAIVNTIRIIVAARNKRS